MIFNSYLPATNHGLRKKSRNGSLMGNEIYSRALSCVEKYLQCHFDASQ